MNKLIVLAAILWAGLHGCVRAAEPAIAATVYGYPQFLVEDQVTVKVTVKWFKTEGELHSACANQFKAQVSGRIAGCFMPDSSTIYAMKPVSWGDFSRLHILGHEFWHALGERHSQ